MKHFLLSEITGFDWDQHNTDKNRIKHQVYSAECEQVFFDSPIYFFDQKHSTTEQRWIALGFSEDKRQLTISFTLRSQKIRVISARSQSKKEHRLYQLSTSLK